MAVIKSLALLLTGLLLTACATSGEKPAPPAAAVVVSEVSASDTPRKPQQPALTPLDEEQRQALDTVLEVMQAGEWQAAREMVQELILSYPQLAVAYANMGNIQRQLGEDDRAEQAWLKALQLRPGWAAVYNQLGLFYREQSRFDEALAMYREAIAADEGYANSHRNIAILYELYLGDGEKALQHYRRYRELLGGEEREVLLWIADLERRVKRAGE